MMEMKEQTGSRKKLLAPVVVLMLCLVTLTGAAYAYSSTLTNTGNTVDAGYLSIDLKQNDAGTAVADDAVDFGDKLVTFTDNYSYAAELSKKNQIGYELVSTETAVVTYKLTIARDNTDPVKFTVKIDGLMDAVVFNLNGEDKKIKDLFNASVTVDGNDAVLSLDEGTVYKAVINSLVIENVAVHEVAVNLTLKTGQGAVAATGYTTAEPFSVTAQSPTAKTIRDAFVANTYTVQFIAEPTA